MGIFLFGLVVPGINNWGHGGGFVGGIVLAFLLGYQERSPENTHHKVLGMFCLVVTALILAWAVVSGALIYLQAVHR